MNIGTLIRDKRKAMHLSQAELSKLSGVPQTTISGYEKNVSIYALKNLQKILKALDLKMSISEFNEK